jgi:NAD(P)-dependent dehydrogenase (short-subunit alcohol dehydrogenase family)
VTDARKTLILTGASRGIGHATVKRFSTAGWRVITCSRHPFPEDCPWDAGPEDHIVVDLASSDDTHKAIAVMHEKLAEHGGKLDALVNNRRERLEDSLPDQLLRPHHAGPWSSQ